MRWYLPAFFAGRGGFPKKVKLPDLIKPITGGIRTHFPNVLFDFSVLWKIHYVKIG